MNFEELINENANLKNKIAMLECELNDIKHKLNTYQNNSKKYYEQKIKNDPEKYAKFLDKCRAPNRKYYHSKQMRIEDELTNQRSVTGAT
jgi:predicted nuclease with TOPRIM domain